MPSPTSKRKPINYDFLLNESGSAANASPASTNAPPPDDETSPPSQWATKITEEIPKGSTATYTVLMHELPRKDAEAVDKIISEEQSILSEQLNQLAGSPPSGEDLDAIIKPIAQRTIRRLANISDNSLLKMPPPSKDPNAKPFTPIPVKLIMETILAPVLDAYGLLPENRGAARPGR